MVTTVKNNGSVLLGFVSIARGSGKRGMATCLIGVKNRGQGEYSKEHDDLDEYAFGMGVFFR
jgi:hypothetical protein